MSQKDVTVNIINNIIMKKYFNNIINNIHCNIIEIIWDYNVAIKIMLSICIYGIYAISLADNCGGIHFVEESSSNLSNIFDRYPRTNLTINDLHDMEDMIQHIADVLRHPFFLFTRDNLSYEFLQNFYDTTMIDLSYDDIFEIYGNYICTNNAPKIAIKEYLNNTYENGTKIFKCLNLTELQNNRQVIRESWVELGDHDRSLFYLLINKKQLGQIPTTEDRLHMIKYIIKSRNQQDNFQEMHILIAKTNCNLMKGILGPMYIKSSESPVVAIIGGNSYPFVTGLITSHNQYKIIDDNK